MIGRRIRELRKSLGMNQTQFALKLDVTPGAVSQWENEVTYPDTERLIAMSRVFGVPVTYFTDEKAAPSTPRTIQARILAAGIDKMPERDREKALNLVRMMFEQYAEFFDAQEGDEDNDSRL